MAKKTAAGQQKLERKSGKNTTKKTAAGQQKNKQKTANAQQKKWQKKTKTKKAAGQCQPWCRPLPGC